MNSISLFYNLLLRLVIHYTYYCFYSGSIELSNCIGNSWGLISSERCSQMICFIDRYYWQIAFQWLMQRINDSLQRTISNDAGLHFTCICERNVYRIWVRIKTAVNSIDFKTILYNCSTLNWLLIHVIEDLFVIKRNNKSFLIYWVWQRFWF